jgi:hypothetical protein
MPTSDGSEKKFQVNACIHQSVLEQYRNLLILTDLEEADYIEPRKQGSDGVVLMAQEVAQDKRTAREGAGRVLDT